MFIKLSSALLISLIACAQFTGVAAQADEDNPLLARELELEAAAEEIAAPPPFRCPRRFHRCPGRRSCCRDGFNCCPKSGCCRKGTRCCPGGGCCPFSSRCVRFRSGKRGCCPKGKFCD